MFLFLRKSTRRWHWNRLDLNSRSSHFRVWVGGCVRACVPPWWDRRSCTSPWVMTGSVKAQRNFYNRQILSPELISDRLMTINSSRPGRWLPATVLPRAFYSSPTLFSFMGHTLNGGLELFSTPSLCLGPSPGWYCTDWDLRRPFGAVTSGCVRPVLLCWPPN